MANANSLVDPAIITEAEISAATESPTASPSGEEVAATAAAAVRAASEQQRYRSSAPPDDGSLEEGRAERDLFSTAAPDDFSFRQDQAQAQLSQHLHHLQAHAQAHARAQAQAQPAPAAVVQHYNPAAHSHLTLYLAALHGSRITADGLSGTFAPPLNHEKLLDWWKLQLTTAAVFLLLRSPPSGVNGDPFSQSPHRSMQYPPQHASGAAAAGLGPSKVSGQDLVGVIMLRSHPAETSPHVATIEMLLVNLQYRQLGGERQLLETVENQAVLEGRTLLTSETESDSTTANMFKELGFTEAGRIPGMIHRPVTGEKRSLSIFYKDLSSRTQ